MNALSLVHEKVDGIESVTTRVPKSFFPKARACKTTCTSCIKQAVGANVDSDATGDGGDGGDGVAAYLDIVPPSQT